MKLIRTTLAGICLAVIILLMIAACSVSQGAPGTPPVSTKGPEKTQVPGPLLTGTTTPTQAAAPTDTSSPVETVAPTETAATTEAATPLPDTPTPAPQALCPQPGNDTSLYISQEKGLCFLVPAGFKIQNEQLRPGEVVTLLGPTEPLGPKQQEGISVLMSIEANGPSEGMDSAAYAREWHQRFTQTG